MERCSACDRPVFLAERLVIGSKLRHRSCFVCARCGHQLNAVTCYETETGVFVCDMCPDEDAKRAEEPLVLETTEPVPGPDDLVLDSKPSDPSKLKFLSDILDGDKTDLSSTNEEINPSSVDDVVEETNYETVQDSIEPELKIEPESLPDIKNEPESLPEIKIEPESVPDIKIEPESPPDLETTDEIAENFADKVKIEPDDSIEPDPIDLPEEKLMDSSNDTQMTEESPVAKNPFEESDEEENAIPVPLARTCRKVEVNDDGKTIIEAPKYLNPFWSESDMSDSEDSPQRPVPAPRLLRTPEPIPRNRFGSSSSLASSSSAGKRKKRPAPQPPVDLRRASSPAASLTARRKSRPAPPPPIDKDRKDYENKVKQNLSPPDKSTYGKWKRKKGAAPGLPIPPQRRRIIPLPVGDIGQEVEDLEIQQRELERQGVKLEQNIRNVEEGVDEDQSCEKDIEEMVMQLFEIVNQKNELFRRQAELMFL